MTRDPAPPTTPAHARRRRRTWFLLWSLLASVLLLEAVLQVGSLAVWWLQRPPVVTMADRSHTVLCIGDSWTQGMGSKDTTVGSYPAQVQAKLRERTGQPWTVANCGLAGQNSREVLERLPGQLAEFRPRAVCVLVGQNDYWSCPEPLPLRADGADGDPGSYRLRWRIPRLWAWVAGKLSGAGQAAVGAATRSGEAWQRREITTAVPYWQTEPSPWPWNKEVQALKEQGWRLAGNDIAGAFDCFRRALAMNESDGQCHGMLASLAHRLGRADEVGPHLDWLRTRYRERGGFYLGNSLAYALEGCGQFEEALGVARAHTAAFPEDGAVWRLRSSIEFYLGQLDEAERSIAQAIRCGPDPWNYFQAYKIQFLGRKNHEAAFAAMFAGYVVFNDAPFLEGMIRAMEPARYPVARRVAETYACPDDVRQRLLRIIDDLIQQAGTDSAGQVLAGHLGRIFATIRHAGAVPVVLCYPPGQKAEGVLRKAALEHEVPFVEVRELFFQRLGSRPWDQVASSDGHCNDDGYAIMADIVTDALLPVLGVGAARPR